MMDASIAAYAEVSHRVEQTNWNALRYFNFYRIVISGLFAALSMIGKLPPNLSDPAARLFTVTSMIYVGLAAVAQIVVEQQRYEYRYQVYGMVLVDIVATGSGRYTYVTAIIKKSFNLFHSQLIPTF